MLVLVQHRVEPANGVGLKPLHGAAAVQDENDLSVVFHDVSLRLAFADKGNFTPPRRAAGKLPVDISRGEAETRQLSQNRLIVGKQRFVYLENVVDAVHQEEFHNHIEFRTVREGEAGPR